MNKKIISNLMLQLQSTEDPVEREELEDRILMLVDQDEFIEQQGITHFKPLTLTLTDPITNQSDIIELDDDEKIRLDREKKRLYKENKYKEESKLESIEDELIRKDMMNRELSSNSDYAFKKNRKLKTKSKHIK